MTKHLAASVAGWIAAAASEDMDLQDFKLGALEAGDGYMLTQGNSAFIISKSLPAHLWYSIERNQSTLQSPEAVS